jgi:tetratricopeptide (TPR) repeat protein
MSLRLARFILLLAIASLAARSTFAGDLKDPYFGEALYYAYQGRYFEALQRLDTEIAQHYGVDERNLDSLIHHIDHAEFSVGDFELYYRMHLRAGRAIRAVLEADVDEQVRAKAAFRLARIHFQKGQADEAESVLANMAAPIPSQLREEVEFLRANVMMALGRPSDAVDILRRLQGSDEFNGFSDYNLGIALLEDGRTREAVLQLDRAGRVKAGDPETLAIRDKSNLVLGTLLFESSDFSRAQQLLERVRLEGPFSNQALLRSGWADASGEKFDRALVPWSILAERDATDSAVQEAMLALPYAYSKLAVHGRAAVLYERAVTAFGSELVRLDSSLDSIDKGAFLEALVREEIRRDKDWVVRLRNLPDAPETFYLLSLMASHDFQTALQNYLDLADLKRNLITWEGSLDAFQDLIGLRREYYEPRLPGLDRDFRKLDAQMRLRLEQRKHVTERLEKMLISPAPKLLVTSDEARSKARLEELERRLGEPTASPADTALRARIARLGGVLTWSLETNYHERLTQAHDHLRQLHADVETLTARYDSFVRARQAATHSYVGYESPIKSLRRRVRSALARLDDLQERQGRMLEAVAIRELKLRRVRLAAYQNQARFAFADSYDRAIKAQAR